MQRIRDEAHRFAIAFHRKLRGKALRASSLDQVIGVGEIRRNTLLKKFGSLNKIAAASDEELNEAGVDSLTAGRLRQAFKDGS